MRVIVSRAVYWPEICSLQAVASRHRTTSHRTDTKRRRWEFLYDMWGNSLGGKFYHQTSCQSSNSPTVEPALVLKGRSTLQPIKLAILDILRRSSRVEDSLWGPDGIWFLLVGNSPRCQSQSQCTTKTMNTLPARGGTQAVARATRSVKCVRRHPSCTNVRRR